MSSRANASYFQALFQFWLRFFTPQSGVARNTACHRTPKWLARRPEVLRPGSSVWSAVASGIPRDTAFPDYRPDPDLDSDSQDFLINYPLTFGVEAEKECDGYGQDNR